MLEQAGSAEQLERLGAALAAWLLHGGETALLDAFEAWITQVLAARTDLAGRSMELRTWNQKEGSMSTLYERVKRWGYCRAADAATRGHVGSRPDRSDRGWRRGVPNR